MTTSSATTSATVPAAADDAAADSVSAPLVAAIERVWAAIIRRHPDVPPVVVTLASGTIGVPAGAVTLGHFAGARWKHHDRGDLAELFVAGEGLAEGARDVLGTLLHEAAHGIATTRDIKDTSRQGRYHNTEYKKLAMELGLTVTRVDPIGWSGTDVPDGTAAEYAAEIDQLTAAIRAHRRSEYIARISTGGEGETGGEATGKDTRASSNNGVPARCGCRPPRRIRVAPSVLALAPITCGACKSEFRATDDDQ